MNIGELSPEAADMEGILDELNALLKLRETGRAAAITDLDWGINEYTSAVAASGLSRAGGDDFAFARCGSAPIQSGEYGF